MGGASGGGVGAAGGPVPVVRHKRLREQQVVARQRRRYLLTQFHPGINQRLTLWLRVRMSGQWAYGQAMLSDDLETLVGEGAVDKVAVGKYVRVDDGSNCR